MACAPSLKELLAREVRKKVKLPSWKTRFRLREFPKEYVVDISDSLETFPLRFRVLTNEV